MEWILENGDTSKTVQEIEDIAIEVRNVMDEKNEFVILSPSKPIRLCNFMQAARISDSEMVVEVSFMQPSQKTHIFRRSCSPDVTICLLTLFCTESAVPDIKDWTFAGEFG